MASTCSSCTAENGDAKRARIPHTVDCRSSCGDTPVLGVWDSLSRLLGGRSWCRHSGDPSSDRRGSLRVSREHHTLSVGLRNTHYHKRSRQLMRDSSASQAFDIRWLTKLSSLSPAKLCMAVTHSVSSAAIRRPSDGAAQDTSKSTSMCPSSHTLLNE